MKKLVEEIKEDFYARAENRKDLERTWLICMNYFAGNQYAELMPTGAIGRTEKKYPWQLTSVFNHVAPIIESRLAKFGKMQTSVTCLPASSEIKDVLVAKFSTRLIKNAWEENGFKKMLDEGTFWSEVCGTAFYKVCWAKNKGPLLTEGLRDGDVEISVCPPYEIYPDDLSASDINALGSIMHVKAYSTDAVEKLWGVRVKSDDPSVMRFGGKANAVFSGTKEGFVLVIERYVAPTADRPNGRLSVVAGETLLYDGDLPYVTEKDGERGFPFVKQTSAPVPASFFGSGLVERLVPIQRAYNEVKNRKHEFFNRLTAGVVLAEDGSVDVDELDENGISPGKVIVYRQGCNPPQMLNFGSVPKEFSEEEDRLLKEFVSVSGVNDYMTMGVVNSSNYSGTALELLTEQNNNRLGVTTENIKAAVKEIAWKIVRLYKQFATDERLNALQNGYLGEKDAFSRSELGADDIVFDVQDAALVTAAEKRNIARQIYDMNLLTGADGNLSDEGKRKLLTLLGCEGFSLTSENKNNEKTLK